MPRPIITAKAGELARKQLDVVLDWLEAAGGGGGGGVSDGDKGDITVSGGGTVWTIDSGAVAIADVTGLSAALAAAGATGGSAVLDFGAAPGSSVASVTITGQTDLGASPRVRAWVQGSTADHNEYEHTRIFPARIGLAAGDVVAGTGFTIHAETELRLTGDVAVKWEWA